MPTSRLLPLAGLLALLCLPLPAAGRKGMVPVELKVSAACYLSRASHSSGFSVEINQGGKWVPLGDTPVQLAPGKPLVQLRYELATGDEKARQGQYSGAILTLARTDDPGARKDGQNQFNLIVPFRTTESGRVYSFVAPNRQNKDLALDLDHGSGVTEDMMVPTFNATTMVFDIDANPLDSTRPLLMLQILDGRKAWRGGRK